MRELNIGTKKHTRIFAVDEREDGGANHEYDIKLGRETNGYISSQRINFQKGAVNEAGVNGVHNEDLIAICIDRLQSFQAGDYKCRKNAAAITKLEEALLWLWKRTMDREDRGVEGTSVV